MVGGIYIHLGNMLASQCQSINWTQQTSSKLQAAFSWVNLLVPGTMYEQASHEASHDLDSYFNLQ